MLFLGELKTSSKTSSKTPPCDTHNPCQTPLVSPTHLSGDVPPLLFFSKMGSEALASVISAKGTALVARPLALLRSACGGASAAGAAAAGAAAGAAVGAARAPMSIASLALRRRRRERLGKVSAFSLTHPFPPYVTPIFPIYHKHLFLRCLFLSPTHSPPMCRTPFILHATGFFDFQVTRVLARAHLDRQLRAGWRGMAAVGAFCFVLTRVAGAALLKVALRSGAAIPAAAGSLSHSTHSMSLTATCHNSIFRISRLSLDVFVSLSLFIPHFSIRSV